MANRIQPHPNPPYLLSDGSLNVSGQIKLFAAGTTTPKIAYKDASGTSYGSVIDLNASGLPMDGPIYWDTLQLYKVEVHTRVDDTPTFVLDYTVDYYGGATDPTLSNTIISPITWTVDKVGATATTFATLEAAMDEARRWVLMSTGALTILILNGTHDVNNVSLSHPQGEAITITGESEAGTILESSLPNGVTIGLEGTSLAALTQLTIKQTGTFPTAAVSVVKGGRINLLKGVRLYAGAGTGLLIEDGSSVTAGDFSVINAATGIRVSGGWLYRTNDLPTWAISSTGGTSLVGVVATNHGVIVADSMDITAYDNCVISDNNSFINIEGGISGSNITLYAYFATNGGVIQSFFKPTTDGSGAAIYNPAANTIKSVTAGSSDLAIIYSPV